MKKILNRLLSRMVITCFLVVVQLAIMILGVVFLQDRYIYISGALKLLSVIVVMYLITKDTNPMVKMAWMVPILIFPVLGGLMYVLYGHVLIPKKLRKNFLRVLQQEVYENVKLRVRRTERQMSSRRRSIAMEPYSCRESHFHITSA